MAYLSSSTSLLHGLLNFFFTVHTAFQILHRQTADIADSRQQTPVAANDAWDQMVKNGAPGAPGRPVGRHGRLDEYTSHHNKRTKYNKRQNPQRDIWCPISCPSPGHPGHLRTWTQHSSMMMIEQTTEQTTEEEDPMPLALLTIKKEGSD